MHPMSLGGAQASILLQKKYLAKLGVSVTIFSGASASAVPHPDFVVLPSIPLTLDREYSLVLNFKKAVAKCEQVFAKNQFDLVHVQGDFWGASLGSAMAKRHNLPLVITSHTNIEYGITKALGSLFANLIIRFMSKSHLKLMGATKTLSVTTNGWKYLAQVHEFADLSLAPSAHFAKALKDGGVKNPILVLPTGVDDEEIQNVEKHRRIKGSPAKLIWAGRLLTEKRILPALEAFAQADTNASLVVYGSGPLEKLARAFVRTRGLTQRVTFIGRVSHQEMLQAFADADALLQTSLGFETQGLTVFEALAVGTPVILSDSNIAGELPGGHHWLDETGTVSGLAETISNAVGEIEAAEPDSELFTAATELLQSTFTARGIELYKSVLAKHS
jgi:glycosyltransferase involved in cell wall biosynthesis